MTVQCTQPDVHGVLHFRDGSEAYNGADLVETQEGMYPDFDDEW